MAAPLTGLTLRERLARCYARPDEARMVAADAGLTVARIDFAGPIDVVWWRVVDEAGKQGPAGLHRLRERARQDYPDAFAAHPPPPPHAVDAIERWLDARWSLLRQVKLLGYRRHERVRLTLDEIFVTLHARVIRRRPDHEPMRFDPHSELAHGIDAQLDLPGALAHAERRGARGLALVGDPGAGKTTLLRHLFCRVRAEGSAAVGLPAGLTPVLLRCADVKPSDRSPGGLADVIRRQVSREGHPEAAVSLAAGDMPLLVLLDGLDEVRDSDERRSLSAWLEDEVGQWRDSRFVVTCRFTAWRDGARLAGPFVEAHIAWLSPDRVRAYVQRWYFAVIVGQDHGDPAEAERRAAVLIETLVDPHLQRRYRLRQMIQNPLMLATLCLVHYAGNRLPERRAELYDECIGFLLVTWTAEAGRLGLDDTAAREVLKPLAWALHERQAGDDERDRARPKEIHRDEVDAIIAEPFRQVPDLDLTVDEFLRRVRDDCGLFSGVDEERYEFLHLSFQEYLAARHAIDENRVVELADRVGEPFWREVILLALSDRAAYGPFMRRVVQRRRVAGNLELLREAFTVAPKLDPAPFLPALRRPTGWGGAVMRWMGRGPDPREVTAILGLFRGRDAPEIRAAAEAWLDAPQPAVAAAARAVAQPEPIPDSGERLDIEWVWVPSGTLWLGTTDEQSHPAFDRDSREDERPPRRVMLRNGFWMSRYAITNRDYGAYLAATGGDSPDYWSTSKLNHPSQPVTGVSWHEARLFARWVQGQHGLPIVGGSVDLPTDAESEYAARGADGRPYPWGRDAPTAERADYGRPHHEGPVEVGSHPAGAGPFGIEDLAGGVWEWCLDSGRRDVDPASPILVDPGRDERDRPGAARVVRGGSWINQPPLLRSASRSWGLPWYRLPYVGFRLVCRGIREPG